jgi:3',5'-cyclic AMP phosphodiesterase CpdA
MNRKDFVQHVGWTGTGIAWALSANGLFSAVADAASAGDGLTFVQISDSHIGFSRPENPDVTGTLQKTIDAINALARQPAFVVHTGDLTHLSKPAQFDTVKSMLATLRAPLVAMPGEHDVIGGTNAYDAAFGSKDAPNGWHSFDRHGVHFVVLVNVFNFEIDGKLGQEQLDWVTQDLAAQKTSTPIVVFGHVPLYALYPQWGWTTEDGAEVLARLARFDAVTVLNGHIHQVIQHTEGNIRFATAASTAYPQPAPGTAEKPGPLLVPASSLLGAIGYRTVRLANGGPADVADVPLAAPATATPAA